MASQADPADAPKGTAAISDAKRAMLKQLFERANAEQAAGRLAEAEASCRELLAIEEAHSGAWHLRGILALRASDPASALAHIERAVALAPTRADCRHSLGFALKVLGRTADAEAAFRQTVGLDADFVEAHYQLGNILRETRRFAAAQH